MQIYGPSSVHGAQSISGPHNASRVSGGSPANSSASIGDRLELSEAGQLAGRMSEIPDIRADRVADIRAQIESGMYETNDKLDTALERLLDEIA